MKDNLRPQFVASVGIMVFLVLCGSPTAFAHAGSQKTRTDDGAQTGKKKQTETTPKDAIHDVIGTTFKSEEACHLVNDTYPDGAACIAEDIEAIEKGNDLSSFPSSPLFQAINKLAYCPGCKDATKASQKGAKKSAGRIDSSEIAYVFHIVKWTKGVNTGATTTDTYVPRSSTWHVYKVAGIDTLKFTGIGSDGNPVIYNKKNIFWISINAFPKEGIFPKGFQDASKSSATQGTPQNQTDLIALFNALTGIKPGAPSSPQAGVPGAEKQKTCDLFLAAGLQPGTARLPFDAKITVVADSSHPDSGNGNNSKKPSSSRDGKAPGEGNLASTNLTTAGNDCTDTNCVSRPLSGEVPTVEATVSGTFTGTLVFEVSDTPSGPFQSAKASSVSDADVSSTTTAGTWTILTGGEKKVRVRVSALTSGTGTPEVSLSTGGAPSNSDSGSAADQGKPQKAQGSSTENASGVMTCTGDYGSLPCTTTRTFTSEDREWWDVSIGITTPGVRESNYSIVNSALSKTETLHTDLYAMLDVFPFAKFAPNDTWRPHVDLGVPVTSKSLYRPYFGVSEPIGGLLTLVTGKKRQISFPIGINFFGGVTWMKTHFVTDDPTTAAALASDSHFTHVWKGVYGIEVSISSIASKIKGAAGKNSNGSGKSSSSSSGDN